MDKRLQDIYGRVVGHGYEVEVPLDFAPSSLGALELRHKYKITVAGIAKREGYTKNLAPLIDSMATFSLAAKCACETSITVI